MKIQQSELAGKIAKVKGVVPSRTPLGVLQNVLIRDGYLIGSNTEVTIQVKLEASRGEEMLIPSHAFELITSLPDEELEITTDERHTIHISVVGRKTSVDYPGQNPADYPNIEEMPTDAQAVEVSAEKLQTLLKSVSFAAGKTGGYMMESINMKSSGGMLSFVALDGHQIAWNQTETGLGEFELTIPKSAVNEIIRLDLKGTVTIAYSKTSAVFRTENYIVRTRLVDGKYYSYSKMFPESTPVEISVDRQDFIDALARSGLCTAQNEPIIMTFDGGAVQFQTRGGKAKYKESLPLTEASQHPVIIGADPKLLKTAIMNFVGDELHMGLINSRSPIVMTEDESKLKEIVLPVSIPEAG
ncbi:MULTISPECIES: DNA polymerase III subunit beta [unclassified Bilifractor]|uniref:DNA polymerase III subunit beta n=1 Tax=unclassified Bilifractor TaxID=2815795 RepID=UPI003F8EEB3D